MVRFIGYVEPTYTTHRPHNALYNNWVSRLIYPSRQAINIFAYNTGSIIYVVSGNMSLALHLIGSLFKVRYVLLDATIN